MSDDSPDPVGERRAAMPVTSVSPRELGASCTGRGSSSDVPLPARGNPARNTDHAHEDGS